MYVIKFLSFEHSQLCLEEFLPHRFLEYGYCRVYPFEIRYNAWLQYVEICFYGNWSHLGTCLVGFFFVRLKEEYVFVWPRAAVLFDPTMYMYLFDLKMYIIYVCDLHRDSFVVENNV